MAIKVKNRSKQERGPGDDEEEEDPLQHEDPFVRTTLRAAAWMRDNTNLVLAGLVALVIAGIGGYAVWNQMEAQEVEASNALSKGLNKYHVPVEGSAEMEAMKQNPKAEVPEKTFSSEDKKWKEIYQPASDTLDSYNSGPILRAAYLSKGGAGLKLEKFDEAVEAYGTYFDKAPKKGSEKTFARYGFGLAQASKGDYNKAIKSFDRVADQNDVLAPLAKYQKGIILEKQGKTEEAKEVYNWILDTHSEFEFKEDIERRLAFL